MKSGAILVAIGIGAFLGVVAVCGGLGAGFLWLVNVELQRESDAFSFEIVTGVDYTLTGPDSIQAGELATMVIEITNTSDTEHRTLYSLDVYTELVNQSNVSADPTPQTMDTFSADGYQELLYHRPLPPGATERIEVHFRPTKPGQYSINIDACIDDAYSFIERFHDLQVTPEFSLD